MSPRRAVRRHVPPPASWRQRLVPGLSLVLGAGAVLVATPAHALHNTPPVGVPDAYTVDEDETLTVDAPGLLANDHDVDGDSLAATLVSQAAHARVTVNEDGSFTYEPAGNFNGTDRFTYRADDQSSWTRPVEVTITVVPVNDAPIAAGRRYRLYENNPLVVPAESGALLHAHDAEGDALTVALVEDVAHGTLTLTPDGSFRYVPDRGFKGDDEFTYAISDGTATSSPATVVLQVDPELEWVAASLWIVGAVRAGETVRAELRSRPQPESLTYEWLLDGTVVGTDETYSLALADIGKQLAVRATLSRYAYPTIVARADPVDVGPAEFANAAVSISGTAEAGETLTATTASTPAADEVTLTWYVGDRVVGTGPSYVVTDADAFHHVRVEASFARHGHVTTTAAASTRLVPTRFAPSIDLDAPAKVRLGEAVELSWSTRGADSVVASGGWTGPLTPEGTVRLKPWAAGVTTYVLTATNAHGTTTVQRTVRVDHPARTLDVTAATEVVGATSRSPGTQRIVVRAQGLAPGEAFTATVAGLTARGTASWRGEAKAVVTAPQVWGARSYAVRVTGSVGDRWGTSGVWVAPAPIKVSLRRATVRVGQRQTVTVAGVNARERVRVRYRGRVVASGRADARGTYRFVLKAGSSRGKFTVRATAVGTGRASSAKVTVLKKRCGNGVARCR